MRYWLKEIRIKCGYTVKSLATDVGISESYYEKIERGERNAPVKTAKKIAEVLGFDWQIFFEEETKGA